MATQTQTVSEKVEALNSGAVKTVTFTIDELNQFTDNLIRMTIVKVFNKWRGKHPMDILTRS